MKLKLLILACILGFMPMLQAQNPGDTIVVQSLVYSSNVRDTVVSFPTDPNLTFERIIMQYNMRCKGAQVSTGADRNKGCGEWDYSCNTFITDSTHIDSVAQTHPSYIISGFSGSAFDYKQTPTNTYFMQLQKNVTVNSTTQETADTVGNGTAAVSDVVQTATHGGKTQFLYTQAELAAAGFAAGTIDALALNVQSNPGLAKDFRVRIKATSKTTLSAIDPDLTSFTEVYNYNTNFVQGTNKIQFYQPFIWNGTDNILVEFSFSNGTTGSNIVFAGDSIADSVAIKTAGQNYFTFDGNNYVEADNYYGISGSQKRTVEAWVRTTASGKEIVSWGTNAAGQKYVVRIDGSGRLRVEINGSNAVGTAVINDGKWHHIAVAQLTNNLLGTTLLVDGQVDQKSSLNNGTVNTGSSMPVRITRGFHNLYWDGEIAEVRIWDDYLSPFEIQDNMYKVIDASNPNYAALQLYYRFDEGTGSIINDMSPNGNNGTVINNAIWRKFKGVDHFYAWQESAKRPNTIFYQGAYNLSVATDTIIDTVQNSPVLVQEYQVYPKPGTIYSDSLGIVMQGNYWSAQAEELIDTAGNVVATYPKTADGTFTIVDLPYWQRSPAAFEIMSFVTPYGIGLDLGASGETWNFDVTDFAPILKGNQRMYMTFGGQWQEEMDIKFLFIVGTPPRDVLDIQQLWKVRSRTYSDIIANKAFEPRDIMMQPTGDAFKIRTVITGHGQEGEFIPRNHYVNVNGGSNEFTWTVWTPCDLNPIYPQGGTWIYDRAGWCPGQASDMQEFDITPYVTPGQTSEIDYGVSTATGDSRYIVNNQLVTYGAPNFNLDVRVEDIVSPTNKIEYSRMGSLCNGPVVRIKNTGATTVNSVEIAYWVNNATTPQNYTYTDSIAAGEVAEITLPVQNLWDDLDGMDNRFFVELSAPNGGTDEYAFNNKMHADFTIPEVVPNDFIIRFKTNNAAAENKLELYDDAGNVLFSRNGMSNNTTYNDTFSLPAGCYTMRLFDTGGDGINFWANNDGAGSIGLYRAANGLSIKNFQPDFGGEINFSFTVDYPLAYDELNPVTELVVYPNPAKNRVVIERQGLENAKISLYNSTGQLLAVPATNEENRTTLTTSTLPSGIYFVHIVENDIVDVQKVIIQK